MHVVVVGAGIAGLAAAHAIGPAARVTIVEGAGRIGGKLLTAEVGGIPVDVGAEAMLARAPEGVGLAEAVGLELTHPATTSASLLVGGAFHPIPTGTLMGVPADIESVRAAGVLSEDGLAKLTADAATEPVTGDVSVAGLVAPRLGREVVDRLVDPLLGGVYAGRADVLSLRATMPALAEELRGEGSLLSAARHVLARSAPGTGPVFATVRDGLGALPAAVLRAAGAELRLGLPVREVRRTERGFRLTAGPVPAPTFLDADAVIVAVPAGKAAPMLRDVAPSASRELAGIEYANIALVTLAYPPVSLPPGSGALVPATEGRAVKALTFSSQKWPHIADGPVIVRASVGRHGEEALLHREDAELVELVTTEIAALVGVSAPPLAARVTRWGGALPQYAVGHADRVRRIGADIASVPGLEVCGAAYEGVGVPACIRTGQRAAARVLAHLTQRAQSSHG